MQLITFVSTCQNAWDQANQIAPGFEDKKAQAPFDYYRKQGQLYINNTEN